MRTLGRGGLGSLLTLGFCLLSLACAQRHAPVPTLPHPIPTSPPGLLRNTSFVPGRPGWQPGLGLPLSRDQAGFVTVAMTPSAEPQPAGWSQSVDVEPGASYLASYRVHTEELAGAAGMHLAFYDAAGRLLTQMGGVPASGNLPWTSYTWRFQAPAEAVRATVELGIVGGRGGRAAFAEPDLLPDDAPMARALIVDYQQETGRIRSFQQLAAGGPGSLAGDGLRLPGPAVDLDALFPNAWADPADPSAYRFEATDAVVAEAAQKGVPILFTLRLGASQLTANRAALVALQIVRHYDEGWAGGLHYDIGNWELQAAPEAGAKAYEWLSAALEALKAGVPGIAVGGPGAAMPDELPFLEGWLSFLAERGQRLDWLSWRSAYDGSPWTEAVYESRLEQLLQRYGLGDAGVIVSEWGSAEAADAWSQARAAAHLVAAETYWQDTRLAGAYRLAGPQPPDAQPRATAGDRAWELMGLFVHTPRRLAAVGGDAQGYTLLAGKSEDGRLVQIAIADVGSRSDEYRLGLDGFPPGYHYTVREISAAHNGEVIAEGEEDELVASVLALPWHSPAVHIITLEWPDATASATGAGQ